MMMSRALLVACLLWLAVLAQAGPKTCPSGCPLMQEGKLEGKNKVLRCQKCSTGYYTPILGACCIECKKGIVSTATDTATCYLCPKDSEPKKSSTGALTCMCKDGTQANGTAPITGVSGCTKCPAGTFNPNRTQALDACQPCPAGLVSGPGAERCTACPANTTANAAQTGCDCASNFFAVPTTPKKPPRKIVKISSDSDGIKVPVCSQCADPTANLAPNLWPSCCAAGTSWNGSACVSVCPDGQSWDGAACASVCPEGSDYVGGVCVCADGATFADQACSCADGAQYDTVNKVCVCDGATWDSITTTCVCGTGSWNGTACV